MPQGEILKTGRWHKKKVGEQNKGYQFKKYRTHLAKNCPVKHLCTSRPAGREIDRASTRKALKKITNAIRKKTRNCRTKSERTTRDINEHIFGTIKRQWGYNHTNLTGLEKKWNTV
jgi:hypothetical protein